MNPQRRRQYLQARYLQAMGIEVWQRRPSAVPSVSADDVAGVEETQETVNAVDESPPGLPLVKGAGISGNGLIAEWDRLVDEVENCRACPLHATRTRAVFGVGDRNADWMVIGEAPGADEDRLGEPFVGRAGRLLDLMLKAMGLAREQVFIANILKSRPPDNRDPKPEEIRACRPYLLRQIELVQPRIFLIMGRIAAQTLLDTQTPVGKLRGTVHRFRNRPLVVTYHPAYLLRSPLQKAKAWQDLQLAQRTLAGIVSA